MAAAVQVGIERRHDRIGCSPQPIDPVVENKYRVGVRSGSIFGILDDEGPEQPTIGLQPGMRVVPMGSRIRCDEGVLESTTGSDGFLRDRGYAVPVVADTDAVPVNAGVAGQ